MLLVCEEMELLGGTLFALDGCKLPSNASKQWSGSVDDLKRKQVKLEEKVKELLVEQEKEDLEDGDESADPDNRSHRQKQVEKLQRQAEKIEAWLEGERSAYWDEGTRRSRATSLTTNQRRC